MVRFEKLSANKVYPYVDATVDADYKNGTFGAVASGVFTAGATGFNVIMNIEKGDDAKSADYKVAKGANARIADLSLVDGQIVDITSEQLYTGVKKGDKMVSKADGTLNAPSTAPTEKYLEVVEVTDFGVRAKIVK